MRNCEISNLWRMKPERINSPIASQFQAFEESSAQVLDVVRRETLHGVEHLSPASQVELGSAVITNIRDSLKLLKASGTWHGSMRELTQLLAKNMKAPIRS